MVIEGEQKRDPGLKGAGLKIRTEGLIQQSPLRERPVNLRSHIFGLRGVEKG